MEKYHFYYDESEHSRRINLNTVDAANYYDNFIVAIVGWKGENEKSIFEKYTVFEEKYADRKSKGELKSQTLRQNQFENGFASMNKSNVGFLDDFFSLFNASISVYFAVISKMEFLVSQIFDSYENSLLFDADAMKYSIVKAILVYQPKEIIEGIFNDTRELVTVLKAFFNRRIQLNEANLSLKQSESIAFEEILVALDNVDNIKTLEWDYGIALYGFRQYLCEQALTDFVLTIDKEGESENTLSAAKRIGFNNVTEIDSKCSIGVRFSDMLAGILSKLLKALHNSLRYKSSNEEIKKKILNREWFILSKEQLELYHKLYVIICELNNAWYKSFAGRYSDDLITLVSLLEYMNHFSSIEEIRKQDIEMQGEYFNSYVCERLQKYFAQMRNKLPIESIPPEVKEYFFNSKGGKVYYDVQRQPLLKLKNGVCKCNVLSVGINKEGVPLVTIVENEEAVCYRLPEELSEWAMTVIGFGTRGTNLFPAEVVSSKYNGKFYANIL